MKKKSLIALLAVLVMCLSLTACGEPTKEELMEDAIEVTCEELTFACLDNKAKAEQTYEGKTVALTGTICRIETEGAYISEDGSWNEQYRVCFETDVLAELSTGQTITVVGTLENLVTFPQIVDPVLIEEE